ncbi:hypothetical protein [Massilia sp. 9096]|uniref:hypothetical protein n=1 Tax=Massilia sp. 9096 TaxID=1500894 RepID=UPI00056ACF27|nr:hypothetical protein [Massilia sp. 9096]
MHIPRPFRRPTVAALLVALGTLTAQAALAAPTTILFIGNSFTFGEPAGAAPVVERFRPGTVTDLNGSGIGGVPALFKAFTEEAGLDYQVSLETSPGKGLDWHYDHALKTISKPFDVAVLQSYSTLDAAKPGNPATLTKYAGLVAQALRAQNPKIDIRLDSTWSRPDQTYRPKGAWYGKPITQMALDLRAGYDQAGQAWHMRVIPVGQAFSRAIAAGLADPDPYDGIEAGKVNLWAPDNYHASAHGYYLEALTIFGQVTGRDPRSLGANEGVAREIGIAPDMAAALQRVAAEQLAQ